jgi:hypothetical protein
MSDNSFIGEQAVKAGAAAATDPGHSGISPDPPADGDRRDQVAIAEAPDSHPAMTPHQRLTVLATGLGIFLVFVDVNIVNVALPSIQRVFHTGEQGLQWAVAGYSLGMAAMLMSCALLGDRYGRRRGFSIGLMLFAGSSVVCLLPVSLAIFTAARVIQGVGAALISVLSLALLSHAFPDPRMKARAIADWMAIGMSARGVGPRAGRGPSRGARLAQRVRGEHSPRGNRMATDAGWCR